MQSLGFTIQHIDGHGQPIGVPVYFDSLNAMLAEILQVEWLAREPRVLRFAIGSTIFTSNDATYTLEAAPFIADGRTMVPLRVISEALGATDLAFNEGVITFNINGQSFTMTIGESLPGDMGIPIIVTEADFSNV